VDTTRGGRSEVDTKTGPGWSPEWSPGRKIRLGWEARLDQLTIAVDLTIVGVGLVVWGAYAGSALMIVPGALVTLVALVRLHGWRSLLWPRTLTIGPDGIADDTRKATAFHVRWPDLRSVGVITSRDAMTLVFTFPQATREPTPQAAQEATPEAREPIPQAAREPTREREATPDATREATPQATRSYRIPRRDAVLPALRATAPCPVTELPPGERVVVDVGTAIGRQGVIGGVLAGFFGVVGLVGAFSPDAATWARVVAGLIGTPLTLVALGTVLSLPVLLRKRQVVVDPVGFTWVDPGGQSFTIPWVELTAVSVDSTIVRNYRSGSGSRNGSGNRYAVRVVLTPVESHPELAKFAAGETYEIRLGSLPRQGAMIADAVAHLAPNVWRGATEKPGRFGLT
jgi:hypothetical protein